MVSWIGMSSSFSKRSTLSRMKFAALCSSDDSQSLAFASVARKVPGEKSV